MIHFEEMKQTIFIVYSLSANSNSDYVPSYSYHSSIDSHSSSPISQSVSLLSILVVCTFYMCCRFNCALTVRNFNCICNCTEHIHV